ncbi:MAG: class I SAM-dependent methyltransferase [Nitrososphaerales archaeon]
MSLTPRFSIPKVRVVLRVPEILRLCANKKVLHLGCADMPYTLRRGEDLLHKRLAKVTDRDKLWGLDISEEGVRILSQMGFDHVVHGDVERMRAEFPQIDFDIILAGEIIEHVANPGLFLKSITSIMSKKTELVLTTPNAFAFKQFLHSMMRREKVHEDHNYYFSYRTLKQLLEKFDLGCKEIYYYQEVEGHGLSRTLDNAFYFMTWISPVWADGLIVRATV